MKTFEENSGHHRSQLEVTMGGTSRIGGRADNQDFLASTLPQGETLEQKGALFAIADGVGGHALGREAAEFSVRSLLSDYYSTPETLGVGRSLDLVLNATNRWLVAQGRRCREYTGMATTLTAVVLRGSRFHLAHVGDSRAYLWRNGQLTQLTEDHVWPHPELTNVLSRAVGLDEHFKLDHLEGEIQSGDRILLATDGTWSALSKAQIENLLASNPDPQAAADALVDQAETEGSRDNCSCLVVAITSVPGPGFDHWLETALQRPLPPTLGVGQNIDGLTVEALLHQSRVTLLYRVSRPTPQGPEKLVLKTLRSASGDDGARTALSHEEWLARRVVNHAFPQVVSHPERSYLYYLMTWHEGETLASRLQRGHRFDPEEIMTLGSGLLKGLGYLHRLGILHRDIKPDNLHIDTEGHLHILDLGVAASEGNLLAEINNPGTPSYMAPELFTGISCSESSDLYAVGVTLYNLLTRKYPYGEIEPFQHPHFGSPVPPTRYRPDTPEWLENILLMACAPHPKHRFETSDEFLVALERGAHRPLTRPRSIPLVERHPAMALKIFAGLSLFANLVSLYYFSRLLTGLR
ncbi:bifunctional protein-serine/threonine kinase/phosphatase [Ferrovum myxofaciens]|uniref:Bifunctional protein-serine/threonine kinase/phosphatase n=1 Tax=Ferrovum myxofaciens TaxID=416213 RepID=A0A9E6SWE3_9PROT|nr:bifunctional protein-serine/threonine kinase/phosphatase [Ferrovum myxofaciens]QKE38304.1 MAG: bifunctional protein-serine/threonine kinase/phosphatase [Ferrovum myxofaciens]QWY76040.1 MAG: bifunctional protein-serine/threonine kinase/phosphatase [Ferrovum myxofaciens]QWY76237.1 MAG: bifunctional protein-serine/threonine kinase/phosphatase [Ferrovum myxofaciens]